MSTIHIDVHHHVLTPHYVEKLANVGVVQSGGVSFPRWKPEDSLAVMDRYGVDVALLSVSSPGLCFDEGFNEQDRQDIEANNALKLFPRLQQ